MRLEAAAVKHGHENGEIGSSPTRARDKIGGFAVKSEAYVLHGGSISIRIGPVTDLALRRLDDQWKQMSAGKSLLLAAMCEVGMVDRGRSEFADRGWDVLTFNRARLVEEYAEMLGQRSRLFPYEVQWLKDFESFGYVTSWRHALRQDTYAGADGTVLRYKAGYELRYQLTLPAVFWWLLMQSNAEVRGRAAEMLASLRDWAGIETDSYQAKGE